MSSATFLALGHERRAREILTGLGYVFAPSQTKSVLLLDTFDGRLQRAGLRLQATTAKSVELTLSGRDTAPAYIEVNAVPRVADDLPTGPFGRRVSALIGIRALLPLLEVRADLTRGVLRDGEGKVIAIAELRESLHVVYPQGMPNIGNPAATMEIHVVPGYAQHAERSRAALRAAGLEECESDTFMVCATAAGIDPAGFTSSATVPLDLAMTAIDGFRLVLTNLADTVAANWRGTIDHIDPEFLHDFRVAVRRTRTVLANAQQVLPDMILGRVREEFEWLMDLTSAPRDLDVYLLEWAAYTTPLGSDMVSLLEPARDLLTGRRIDVQAQLADGLSSTRATELMNFWQTWLTEPLDTGDIPARAHRPLGRVLAKRVTRAHDLLLARGRLITPDTPAEQVHDLRKHAKRLRYLLECFGSLLPKDARKQYVRRLKVLQDNLGEHQDAEVHIQMLRAVANELHEAGASANTMLAIGHLAERLDQQRVAARLEFAERFASYDSPATHGALDAMLNGIRR